ncbi:serine hydrolase [Puia dinghuensis]|uniref:Serine hydrolase n=1 Tax=Puia dinghuensis TaxID=1792502 RepID=A0A8J2XRI2_9BACT|nr:serine hydrolase [Puia dinghuensis]GGB01766.1 hypothetical protein GCM10011511_26210 [Puia dinghuensis]
MRIPAIFCSLFLFAAPLFAQKHQGAANPLSGLDTTFDRVLKTFHVAGFAVAVVEKDSILYANGFGYRDWENKIPVTPHTLFAIGSCTKAFTASLLGILEQEGQVNLDKPVRDYLPSLKFYNEQMDNTITLRDMMCHRTGLPRYDFSWYFFRTSSRDSLLGRIRYMEPTAGIRERWQYNNFMFFAQGMVVEKLTHQTWEENITNRIFRPLGMTESTLSIEDMVKQKDFAVGYGLRKDSIIKKLDYFKEIHAIAPAGAINSNVLDMSSWLKTWIHGGKYHGKEMIPGTYATQAISSQVVIGGGLPSKESPDVYFATYGLGWSLSSYRGHYRVEHGGNIDGFSANACLFPADSIGIIVLTNQDGSAVPAVVRNIIADRLLHLPYKNWTTQLHTQDEQARRTLRQAEAAKISNRKPGTHTSHPLQDYTGLYNNPAFGTFEVSLKGDSLFASLGNEALWLKHFHYDIFIPVRKDREDGYDTTGGDESNKMQFDMDPAGDITTASIPLEPSLNKPIVFTRAPKGKPLDSAQLQKYVGEYVFGIGAVTAKVYTKGKTLYLFVAGQPEYELANIGPDKFTITSLSGYTMQFVTDAQGQVTGLMAIQPNGTFKATRKK